MSSVRRPGPFTLLLALLGPLALVGAWVGLLWRMGASDPAAWPALPPAEVLVLGNSISRLDVDPRTLQTALGATVTVLAPDETTSADWVLLLRERVLRQGWRPRMVIIPTLPGFALDPRPRSGAGRERLLRLLSEDDDPIRSKALGQLRPRWIERLSAGRGALRNAVLRRVGLTVLGDAARLPAAIGRYVGRTEARAVVAADTALNASFDGSLMPELLQLAAEHDLSLVFVNPPVRDVPARERVDPAALEELAARLTAHPHAAWIELSWLQAPEGAWVDDSHLGPGGARWMSTVLGWRMLSSLDLPTSDPVCLPERPCSTPMGTPRAVLGAGGIAGEVSGAEPSMQVGPGLLADRPGVFRVLSQPLGRLSDQARLGRFPARPCIPYNLSSADQQLTLQASPESLSPGGFVATAEGLLATADGVLRATLRPTRCGESVWVHPGGELVLDVPSDRLGDRPIKWVVIGGEPAQGIGQVLLDVVADGRQLLLEEIDTLELDGLLRIRLNSPIPVGAQQVQIRILHADDGTSILWHTVWLLEAG